MVKKFLEGLSFGAGFGVSFLLLWFAGFALLSPWMTAGFAVHQEPPLPERGGAQPGATSEGFRAFDEMDPASMIRQARAILLARYEAGDDGRMKAVVRQICKVPEDVPLPWRVGDEYPAASYYPGGGSRGDGVVVFLDGNPLHMKLSVSIRDDRVSGLGDMPLALLLQQCRNARP